MSNSGRGRDPDAGDAVRVAFTSIGASVVDMIKSPDTLKEPRMAPPLACTDALPVVTDCGQRVL